MNWKGCGSKWSWHYLCWEELQETIWCLRQSNRRSDRYLNQILADYKSEIIQFEPTWSVTVHKVKEIYGTK